MTYITPTHFLLYTYTFLHYTLHLQRKILPCTRCYLLSHTPILLYTSYITPTFPALHLHISCITPTKENVFSYRAPAATYCYIHLFSYTHPTLHLQGTHILLCTYCYLFHTLVILAGRKSLLYLKGSKVNFKRAQLWVSWQSCID